MSSCTKNSRCKGSYVEWSARIVSPDNLSERPFTNVWESAPSWILGKLVQLHILKLPRVAVAIGSQTKSASANPLYLDMRDFPSQNTPIIAGTQLYVTSAWEQLAPELFTADGVAPAMFSSDGIKVTNFDDGIQIWFQSVAEAVGSNDFRPNVYLRTAYGEWSKYWFSNDLRDATPTRRPSQVIVVPVRDADRIYAFPDFGGSPADGARVSYGRLTAPNPKLTDKPDDLVVRFAATIME